MKAKLKKVITIVAFWNSPIYLKIKYKTLKHTFHEILIKTLSSTYTLDYIKTTSKISWVRYSNLYVRKGSTTEPNTIGEKSKFRKKIDSR